MNIDGYKAASIVDKEVNDMLEKCPISAESVLEWMKFSRTVETIINLINMDIDRVNGKNIGGKIRGQ